MLHTSHVTYTNQHTHTSFLSPGTCLILNPYPHRTQASDVWGALLGELASEAAAVSQWLLDREVEAPERYSAVQSYRAAMSVLRQQQHFLEVRGGQGRRSRK